MELVFALLTRTTGLPQTTVRLLSNHLLHLDLLHIPALAHLLKGKPPELDFYHPNSLRIITILEEGGFSHSEAMLGLTVMCEAASAISAQFFGKIQFYLRGYAERMVNEAQTIFHFSLLNQNDIRYAFSFWLQNVLNMPLPLPDKDVESFSRANGLTSEQIFDAADEMDVNVAYVDDLLHHFYSTSHMIEAKPNKTKKLKAKTDRKKP